MNVWNRYFNASSRSHRVVWTSMVVFLSVAPLLAATPSAENLNPSDTLTKQRSITDRTVRWPTTDQWLRVLTLRDYNTRVVVGGTMMLGLAAGTIGSFTLLRKRALMGDALSHATLPGIALMFLLVTLAGGPGKSLPLLLLGGTLSGVLGVGAILFIRNTTRLKEDTALGIVLSVFFGGGIALLGIIQNLETGHAAGLESFIYGKTASMVALDAQLIGIAGVCVALLCGLMFKELRLLCFDENYARTLGYRTIWLDIVMMALVTAVTVIGLQAVGLVLVIALLIVPAAAARFWTEKMSWMVVGAALIGALSALIGAACSAVLPRLPSGAMIVVVATVLFLISMIFGPARGVLTRSLRRRKLNRTVDRQHLLRAIYEQLESDGESADAPKFVTLAALFPRRSWSMSKLRRLISRARRDGMLDPLTGNDLRLTPAGLKEAERLVREHRLWEMYLITYADIAPSQVDRSADRIEHVLEPRMIAELESLVKEQRIERQVPGSPHPIELTK